ncbi:inner membrane transport permease [Azospira sp. I13]|uniref:ABC transporter permease n=1 Tax=Azospira sp. I13 TaxID=1765050 RepID=UPI000D45A219|nr:FtsX-like permease family protein [Azospira sp. I13]GBG01472.1 inner membrane transport permease [Azospira sp. I13]
MLSLAFRLLRRDFRAGELKLLALALVVAVASISSVGFFTDRVKRALERESRQLLGADLLLTSDHPLAADTLAEARRLGLQTAETRVFPSMVTAGEGEAMVAQLADIKAVSAAYPLRGKLRLAPQPGQADTEFQGGPPAGSVWLDERLATQFEARPGQPVQHIQLGQARLNVAGVLTLEPDRGVNFFSVAPRLMMNLADLPATQLIQPGSRVAYRLLLAGPDEAVAAYRRWVEPRLGRGERLEDASNARPEIRTAVERAQQFLGLSSLLAVVLAAAGVALAIRRYLQRHLDPCAVMRCLGAPQGQVLGLYLGQFLILGVAASAAGLLIGFGAHFVLHAWLANLLASPLPSPGPWPALQGLAAGLVLLFGFALPPLLQLRQVPTLRVLRRELGDPDASILATYGIGLAALAGLLFWAAGDPKLGAYAAGGFTAALGLTALIARLALAALKPLRHGAAAVGFGWRYGLAGLERRPLSAVAQIVALSLGLMALLLLTVTRGDLMQSWRQASPPDAPNRFAINIQPEQRQDVGEALGRLGIRAELSPMVRGRLTGIGGRPVTPADYEDDRAKRLVEREFNLSWAADLPPGNSITQGRWFAPGEQGKDGKGSASVEKGLAETLGVKVGDELTFTVAGEPVQLTVTSLRKLNWDSMRVNFFVLTPPGVLEPYPASYITSFHLPDDAANRVGELVKRFPNLTVVDVAAIVRQLQSVLDQVSRAVQFVFLFTLAAGVIVLYGALAASHDERRYELSVLRALGAGRQQLRGALLAEFAAVGALSGLIAAAGSQGVGWLLAAKVFNLEYQFAPWIFPVAIVGAALAVTLAGWLAASRLLRVPPMEALRAGG